MSSVSKPFPAVLVAVGRVILWLEPLYLALTTLAFFYPTPTRTNWLWLLWLLVPVVAARYVVHGRLLTRTPLNVWFAALLVLGVLNVYLAPYTRGLLLLARPVLGIATYLAMVESARTSGRMRGPLQVIIMLGLLVGVLAIGSTQWNPKSAQLSVITGSLPDLQGFPGAEAGFNANEIAGGLSWLVPLMAGLALYRWQQREPRWHVTLAFILMFAALLLGQSRSALIGVFIGLAFLIPLIIKRLPWRVLTYVALLLAAGFQVWVSADFAASQAEIVETAQNQRFRTLPLQTHDERNINVRLEIWSSALAIIRDHPLTGVGLSMFRDGRVRADYPVPMMEDRILPHAHNEPLQIGSDMGIPGLVVFVGIYAAAGYMLLQSWRQGGAQTKAVSASIAAGLLAHAIYGLADAVTLWDRLTFIYWLMLGLVGAQYVLVVRRDQPSA